MNLTSCKMCGVVLDKDHLAFPEIYDHDTQELIVDVAEWDGDDYVAVIDCPVCENTIKETD